jgi:hypothetical protein
VRGGPEAAHWSPSEALLKNSTMDEERRNKIRRKKEREKKEDKINPPFFQILDSPLCTNTSCILLLHLDRLQYLSYLAFPSFLKRNYAFH